MANNYLQAAFAVTVTASEARLIAAVQRAIEAIDSGVEGDEATAFVADLGPEFATAFPGGDADPFAGGQSCQDFGHARQPTAPWGCGRRQPISMEPACVLRNAGGRTVTARPAPPPTRIARAGRSILAWPRRPLAGVKDAPADPRVLLGQFGGHLVAKEVEPLPDPRQLVGPLVRDEGSDAFQRIWADV